MRFTGAARYLPRTYAYSPKNADLVLAQFAERFHQSKDWTLYVLDTEQHLQYAVPHKTAAILLVVSS